MCVSTRVLMTVFNRTQFFTFKGFSWVSAAGTCRHNFTTGCWNTVTEISCGAWCTRIKTFETITLPYTCRREENTDRYTSVNYISKSVGKTIWEASSRSASQKILRPWRILKVHYWFHKIPHPHPSISYRLTLILSSHVRVGLPSCFFPSCFLSKMNLMGLECGIYCSIIPICEQRHKTDCSNCRGISLISNTYNIFSYIFLSRLTLYVDEVAGYRRYQSK